MLQEFHSEESIINILLPLMYHIFTHLSISNHLSTRLIFFNTFHIKLQTFEHFFLNASSDISLTRGQYLFTVFM